MFVSRLENGATLLGIAVKDGRRYIGPMSYTISYSIGGGAALAVGAVTPEEAIAKGRRFASQGYDVQIRDFEGGTSTLKQFEELISAYRRRTSRPTDPSQLAKSIDNLETMDAQEREAAIQRAASRGAKVNPPKKPAP
jgi:hypothetical protein